MAREPFLPLHVNNSFPKRQSFLAPSSLAYLRLTKEAGYGSAKTSRSSDFFSLPLVKKA